MLNLIIKNLNRIFLFSILLGNLLYGQSNNFDDSILVWSNQKPLKWSYFRASPTLNSSYSAISDISIGYYTSSNKKKDSVFVHVYCYFNKNKSWVSIKSINLLKHEQTHFNISEYYARLLKEYISKLGTVKSSTILDNLKKIYQDFLKKCDKEQQKYDTETNYSIDTLKQNLWNNKLDSLLAKYDHFSGRTVKLKVTWNQ